MARIYDNIELKFEKGLQDIITNTGVKRVDFCVGYFNLRGCSLIYEQVDTLEGDFIDEDFQTTQFIELAVFHKIFDCLPSLWRKLDFIKDDDWLPFL